MEKYLDLSKTQDDYLGICDSLISINIQENKNDIFFGIAHLNKFDYEFFVEHNDDGPAKVISLLVSTNDLKNFLSDKTNLLKYSRAINESKYSFGRIYSVNPETIEYVRHERSQIKMSEKSGQEVKLAVRFLLSNAVKAKASDIHIRVKKDTCLVDFWIWDELRHYYTYTRELMEEMLRELHSDAGGATSGDFDLGKSIDFGTKILDIRGKLNIGARYHHDSLANGETDVTIRLSSNPVNQQDRSYSSMSNFGLTKDQAKRLNSATLEQSGVILLVGPVNSGKTSTIRNQTALLWEHFSEKIKIIAVQDPSEISFSYLSDWDLESVVVKLPDPKAIPSTEEKYKQLIINILRANGQKIIFGEIRNSAAAKAAIEIEKNGLLLLSTIHAKSSVGAFSRLSDLSIPRKTLFQDGFIQATQAQELALKLCSDCNLSYEEAKKGKKNKNGKLLVNEELLETLQIPELSFLKEKSKFINIDGCDNCFSEEEDFVEKPNGTMMYAGNKGVTNLDACAEVLTTNDNLLKKFLEDDYLGAQYYKTLNRLYDKGSSIGLTTVEHMFSKVCKGEVCLSSFNHKHNLLNFYKRCKEIDSIINSFLTKNSITINHGNGFSIFQYLQNLEILEEWQNEFNTQLNKVK